MSIPPSSAFCQLIYAQLFVADDSGLGRGLTREKFIINASQPASDKIFDVSAFEKFLQDKIKVDGRVGNLGDVVEIKQVGEGKIEVVAHINFSGRYLKYLYVYPHYYIFSEVEKVGDIC